MRSFRFPSLCQGKTNTVSAMVSCGRLVSIVCLLFGLGTWIIFSVGFWMAFSETERMVYHIDNCSNTSAASMHVLPLFVPHTIAAICFPIVALSACVDLYLSESEEERVVWHFTTTVASIGGTVFLLSAGSTIFVTVVGTGFSLKAILEHYGYFDNELLWNGNIIAMFGILATTAAFIAHMCYWPHALKPKRDQAVMLMNPLLNVSGEEQTDQYPNYSTVPANS